jgi:hypothetical protein
LTLKIGCSSPSNISQTSDVQASNYFYSRNYLLIMSFKAASKKQRSLFDFGGRKDFKLKIYQHIEKDKDGNDILVNNKISSSKPNCIEHILDISELLKPNIGWLSIG